MTPAVADQLAELQRLANHCAWLFQSYRLRVEYRIIYAIGVDLPWRLAEIHRNPETHEVSLRRMHCFASAETLRRSIEERANWKRQDRALVASHLPKARRALQSSPGVDALEQVRSVHAALSQDLAALELKRRALREQLCRTKADRVINLPLVHRPRSSAQPTAR